MWIKKINDFFDNMSEYDNSSLSLHFAVDLIDVLKDRVKFSLDDDCNVGIVILPYEELKEETEVDEERCLAAKSMKDGTVSSQATDRLDGEQVLAMPCFRVEDLPSEASKAMRKVLASKTRHRETNAQKLLPSNACVARPVGRKEMLSNPQGRSRDGR